MKSLAPGGGVGDGLRSLLPPAGTPSDGRLSLLVVVADISGGFPTDVFISAH